MANGTNKPLGIVCATAQGEWQANTSYQKLSIVRSGTASYQAKSASTNIQPGVTNGWQTYWMLLNNDGGEGVQGPQGIPGEGVPTGGLTGQVLVKQSNENYDTEWVDQSTLSAGSAVSDGEGNNITETYETKAEAASTQAALQEQIVTTNQNIQKNNKQITNLEQRITPSPFVTDSTVDYIKDVPSNALPYAELKKIGGMTVRDEATSTFVSAPATGVKIVGNNLLTYTYSGSISQSGVVLTRQPDGGITASGTPTAAASTLLVDTKPIPIGITGVWISLFGTFTNLAVRLQLYDSTKRSLLLADYTEQRYVDIAANYPTAVYYSIWIARKTNNVECSGTIYPMMSRGQPTEYVPYTETTFPIPEAVQALDGYGQGNPDNAEEYNYIDFERQKFVAYGHVVDGAWVEFASVQETDISNLISPDNFIKVEPYGSLTFENEHQYAVPSTIEYMT